MCWVLGGISVPVTQAFTIVSHFYSLVTFFFLNRNLIITSKILANHTTVKKKKEILNSLFPPFFPLSLQKMEIIFSFTIH